MVTPIDRSVYVGRTASKDSPFGQWKVQAYEGRAAYGAEYCDDETTAWVTAADMANRLGWPDSAFRFGDVD